MVFERKVLNESELRSLFVYLFTTELPAELVALVEAHKALDLVGQPMTKDGMVKRWAEMSPRGRWGYYDFLMRPDSEADEGTQERNVGVSVLLANHREYYDQLAAVMGWKGASDIQSYGEFLTPTNPSTIAFSTGKAPGVDMVFKPHDPEVFAATVFKDTKVMDSISLGDGETLRGEGGLRTWFKTVAEQGDAGGLGSIVKGLAEGAEVPEGRHLVSRLFFPGAVGGGGCGAAGYAPDGVTEVVPGKPVLFDGMVLVGGGGGGGDERFELSGTYHVPPGMLIGLGGLTAREEAKNAYYRTHTSFEQLLKDPQALLKDAAKDNDTIAALLKHKEEAEGNEARLRLIDNLLNLACYTYVIAQVKKCMSALNTTIADTMFDTPPAGLMPTGLGEDEVFWNAHYAIKGRPQEVGVIDLMQDPCVTPLLDEHAPGDSPEDPEPQGS